MVDINNYAPRSGRLIREDNTIINEANGINADGSRNVQLTGSTLVEQKTEADAVGGVLTFSANFGWVEIYNTDTINDGTFVVNGITIHVPKSTTYYRSIYKAAVGGTPGATVTVTGATTYIVSRYV